MDEEWRSVDCVNPQRKCLLHMAITRIFTVQIKPLLRKEFEEKFSTLSIAEITKAAGLIEYCILKPSRWAPDEYAMISKWTDETSLIAFAGNEWRHAVIPSGMEHYAVNCWVQHYSSWDEI